MLRCASAKWSGCALCALCAIRGGLWLATPDRHPFPFISILRTLSHTLSSPYLYTSVPLGWAVKLPAYCLSTVHCPRPAPVVG